MAINKLKDPPTWLKVATTLEKPPTPTHWLHQTITWTNIDWSLVKSSDSHIMTISKEMPQRSITKIGLKIIYKISLKFPRGQWVNTLRPRQNGRHFADDVFKCIFLNGNLWILIKISLKFVPKDPINNIPALVLIMAWRRTGDKPFSEPMMA